MYISKYISAFALKFTNQCVHIRIFNKTLVLKIAGALDLSQRNQSQINYQISSLLAIFHKGKWYSQANWYKQNISGLNQLWI